MLRAANTGISAIIDHRGVVMARSRQFVPTVVKGSVQPVQGATLYVLWGNAGMVALTLSLLGISVAASLVSRRRVGLPVWPAPRNH